MSTMKVTPKEPNMTEAEVDEVFMREGRKVCTKCGKKVVQIYGIKKGKDAEGYCRMCWKSWLVSENED